MTPRAKHRGADGEAIPEDEILDRMSRHAVRKAHQMLPAQEVEDAVQTAIFQVWRRLPRLDPDRDPWPLLTRIVRQELAMYAREFYAHRAEASLQPHAGTERAPDPTPGRSPQNAMSSRLQAILEDLPERQREAMIECVAEGRTKQQAAAIMGVSDVSVATYIKRALPVLREGLAA